MESDHNITRYPGLKNDQEENNAARLLRLGWSRSSGESDACGGVLSRTKIERGQECVRHPSAWHEGDENIVMTRTV